MNRQIVPNFSLNMICWVVPHKTEVLKHGKFVTEASGLSTTSVIWQGNFDKYKS